MGALKNIDRMGVLYLMAHLLITLFLIGCYFVTAIKGIPDETFKMGVFMVLGYWFGAAGIDKVKAKKPTNPLNEQPGEDGKSNE